MDWKLTDEELRDTSKVAADKWLEQPPATSDEAGWVQAIDEAQRSLTLAVRRAIADAAVRKALQAVDGLVIGDCMQSDNNGPFYVRVDAEGLEALKQEVGL